MLHRIAVIISLALLLPVDVTWANYWTSSVSITTNLPQYYDYGELLAPSANVFVVKTSFWLPIG
jgi:hypothetical protein